MFTHHAVVCFTTDISPRQLPRELQEPSVDVVHKATDRLTIDDVRGIKEVASGKPVAAPMRSIVVLARELQAEAQHALLKLLEEPPADTRLIFVLPRTTTILPTIRSRVQVVELREDAAALPEAFTSFLAMPYSERLEHVASITKEKDAEAVDVLVRGAEQYVVGRVAKLPELARTLRLIRRYLSLPGTSRKMLLEALALALPVERTL